MVSKVCGWMGGSKSQIFCLSPSLRQDWTHTDMYGQGHLQCCITPPLSTTNPWPIEVPGDMSLSGVAVGLF